MKQQIGTTRIKRLVEENESLKEARDRAIEAAARNRLIADLALTSLLKSLEIDRLDEEDLMAIKTYLEKTDYVEQMTNSDVLSLIRSLTESMDSIEVPYINSTHAYRDLTARIYVEAARLTGIKAVLKKRLGDSHPSIHQIEIFLNLFMWVLGDEATPVSYSDYLKEKYGFTEDEIEAGIALIESGSESEAPT